MPGVAIVAAIATIGFEALVQSTFGAMGVVGLLLLTIGVKARSVACGCVGAVVLTMLFAAA
ncbi:hypothetical protein JFN87_22015 [Streptomyces bomunensis]|uniref:Uncharacterized protein n=2 Tax=Streptomyces TaxID=1883 RepID=A0A940RWG8_9ACTN|nr:hypothetical protein [Streptomyces montanisoli]